MGSEKRPGDVGVCMKARIDVNGTFQIKRKRENELLWSECLCPRIVLDGERAGSTTGRWYRTAVAVLRKRLSEVNP